MKCDIRVENRRGLKNKQSISSRLLATTHRGRIKAVHNKKAPSGEERRQYREESKVEGIQTKKPQRGRIAGNTFFSE